MAAVIKRNAVRRLWSRARMAVFTSSRILAFKVITATFTEVQIFRR
jgi:hypothetical protein